MEIVAPGTDEVEVTGAEDDGVDESCEAKGAEGIGLDDEVDVTGTGDDENGFELAEVVFTITTVVLADEVDNFDDVEEGWASVEDDFIELEMDVVQSPKPAWQPFPQYAEDEPQNPFFEQQFPNAESLQVRLLLDC